MGEGFVKKIKDLCIRKGMNIKQLEIALGFGNGAIGKMAHQKTSGERIKAIADYFEISVDELLSETENPAPNFGNGITSDEMELIRKYRLLNNTGKGKVDEYITLISESDRYIKTYQSGRTQVG